MWDINPAGSKLFRNSPSELSCVEKKKKKKKVPNQKRLHPASHSAVGREDGPADVAVGRHGGQFPPAPRHEESDKIRLLVTDIYEHQKYIFESFIQYVDMIYKEYVDVTFWFKY